MIEYLNLIQIMYVVVKYYFKTFLGPEKLYPEQFVNYDQMSP